MNLNEFNIEELVEYVNRELKNGRTMKSIENEDFHVNERVIAKRLTRKKYKRINNLFIKSVNNLSDLNNLDNLDNKSITKCNTKIDNTKIINNTEINNKELMELIELIGPIKEMLYEFNRNKDIIDVHEIKLEPGAVREVRQKLFKIDVNVLDRWEEFINNHKEFKVQQLISLALDEFINKYS